MNDCKYNDLRITLEKAEKIKTDFTRKFTEEFSNYMGCPTERLELIMDNPIIFSNYIKYNATLKFSIPVGQNEVVLEVYDIDFIYDSNDGQSKPSYKVSFDNQKSILDSNALLVFCKIYDWLRPDNHPTGVHY
jgi:hypothetical protein